MAHRSLPHRLATACVLVCLIAGARAAPAGRPEFNPGDVPPPAIGHDESGAEILLPAFDGKAVIVTFWATWCRYCLKELPVLEAVQNKAGKDNMMVIAVNTEDSRVFRKAARIMREGMHLELVSDADGKAQKAYGVNGIPHMVIIGRDGKVMRVYRGYSEDSLDDIIADINTALLQPRRQSAP